MRKDVHEQFVYNQCVELIKGLSLLFKPHCLLTLVVRNPEMEDSDLIVTQDDYDAVIAAIRHLRDTGQDRDTN